MEFILYGMLWFGSLCLLGYFALTAVRDLLHDPDTARRDLALLYVGLIALPPMFVFVRALFGLVGHTGSEVWAMIFIVHALHLKGCLLSIPLGFVFGWRMTLQRLPWAGLPPIFLWSFTFPPPSA